MVRINITLPENVVHELKRIKNRSRFIADAVREKFEEDKRRRLEERLIEGYKNSAKEDGKINREWETATLESEWR